MKIAFDWDEVNELIVLLSQWGVCYLMGSAEPDSLREEDAEPVRLISRLAACGYPLVEHASISLFLLHPELAPAILQAYQTSEPDIAENIAVFTLAALYMQQWWLFRLAWAFGRLPDFPEEPFVAFWQDRHLPPPQSGYGRDGLLALQEYEQQRFGAPLNFLHDWQNQIDHLLAQEEAYHRELSKDAWQILIDLSQQERTTFV